jgi:hypothetical protein
MKIGILTFHKSKNYGAILQAFALMTTLRTLGHEPTIINRPNKKFKLYRFVLHLIKDAITLDIIRWHSFKRQANKLLKPKSTKYDNDSILDFEKREDFDCCIVGSDQVWRVEYSQIGLNYFFDFITNNKIKKISYAASFGMDSWKEQENITTKVKELIKKFDGVSVREKSGLEICKDIFDVEATLVLDPTLLLTKEKYIELFQLKPYQSNSSKKKLVSYIIGRNKIDLIKSKKLAKENNLKHKNLFYNTLNPFDSYTENPFNYFTPKDWLQNILEADYVITNSYHGTIFSIIFEKPFFVLNNESAGITRLKSLLTILNLKNRLIESMDYISFKEEDLYIDFKKVKETYTSKKELSIGFLKEHLR